MYVNRQVSSTSLSESGRSQRKHRDDYQVPLESSSSSSQVELESSETSHLLSRSRRSEPGRSETQTLSSLTSSDVSESIQGKAKELGPEKLSRNARKPGLKDRMKDSAFGQFMISRFSEAPPYERARGSLVVSDEYFLRRVKDPGLKAHIKHDTVLYAEPPDSSRSSSMSSSMSSSTTTTTTTTTTPTNKTFAVQKGDKCTFRKTDNPNLLYVETYKYENKKLKIVSAGYAFTRDVKANIKARSHVPLDVRAPIFPHPPSPRDIKQGAMGDCFFLAGLASIVDKDPDAVTKMIRDNGNGTVTVRIFDVEGTAPNKTFKPFYITFEKSILHTDFSLMPERADAAAPWVGLMEKAYAIHLGSYALLNEGGYASDVYEALLGKPAVMQPLVSGSIGKKIDSVFCQGDELVPTYKVTPEGLKALEQDGLSSKALNQLKTLCNQGLSKQEMTTLIKDLGLEDTGDETGEDTDEDRIKARLLNPEHKALSDLYDCKKTEIDALRYKPAHLLRREDIEKLFEPSESLSFSNKAINQVCLQQGVADGLDVEVKKILRNRTFKNEHAVYKALAALKPDLSTKQIEALIRNIEKPEQPQISKQLQKRILASFAELMAEPRGSGNYKQSQLDLFDQIEQGLESGMIMSAGTPEKIHESESDSSQVGKAGEEIVKGLVGGHAFSITGAIVLKPGDKGYPGPDDGPPLRFIQVRNPWGNMPGGLALIPSKLLNLAGIPEHGARKYSYNSKTDQLEAYGSRKADYMVELSDFCNNFREIYFTQD